MKLADLVTSVLQVSCGRRLSLVVALAAAGLTFSAQALGGTSEANVQAQQQPEAIICYISWGIDRHSDAGGGFYNIDFSGATSCTGPVVNSGQVSLYDSANRARAVGTQYANSLYYGSSRGRGLRLPPDTYTVYYHWEGITPAPSYWVNPYPQFCYLASSQHIVCNWRRTESVPLLSRPEA
jgi:hypothetical protein